MSDVLWSGEIEENGPNPGQFIFQNDCEQPVQLAIFFMNKTGYSVKAGWWPIAASATNILADGQPPETYYSNDSLFYFYARTTTAPKHEWRGSNAISFKGEMLPMRSIRIDGPEKRFSINC